jgi:hypothetical protein
MRAPRRDRADAAPRPVRAVRPSTGVVRRTGQDGRSVAPAAPAAGPLRPRPLPRHGATGDRGDVPGWVLVTLMTAGLVVALWAVAGPALAGVFETAIARVTSVG